MTGSKANDHPRKHHTFVSISNRTHLSRRNRHGPPVRVVARSAQDSAEAARAHVHCVSRHGRADRKSTRLNSSHSQISYAVFCLKKKKQNTNIVLYLNMVQYFFKLRCIIS